MSHLFTIHSPHKIAHSSSHALEYLLILITFFNKSFSFFFRSFFPMFCMFHFDPNSLFPCSSFSTSPFRSSSTFHVPCVSCSITCIDLLTPHPSMSFHPICICMCAFIPNYERSFRGDTFIRSSTNKSAFIHFYLTERIYPCIRSCNHIPRPLVTSNNTFVQFFCYPKDESSRRRQQQEEERTIGADVRRPAAADDNSVSPQTKAETDSRQCTAAIRSREETGDDSSDIR